MWQNNPLVDKEFLKELDAYREREIYARIIALNFDEEPVELIEGQVTQGTINIDGSSAVRRTCALSLVTRDMNINDFYWGVKSKVRVEIGLKNIVDNVTYPDIVWFPQGTFVLTTFSTAQSTNGYNVNIQGKDKMCLLNGELGGNLIASIDFGVEEYWDRETDIITYNKIPIKRIMREAIHTYANEPYHNIIINDLDEAAIELMEYRGDTPLYLFRDITNSQDGIDINDGEFTNFTLNGDTKIIAIINNAEIETSLESLENIGGKYDTRVEINADQNVKSTVIKAGNGKFYTVAKVEYGQTAGYRITDLTYAGDLISTIGESLTSIFDKIINMLGEYEYFYDLQGRFIFQRKKTYLSTSWNNIVKVGEDEYVDSAAHTSQVVYSFENGTLVSAFNNSPQLSNLKNDYSIWGKRDSITNTKIPVHYRYAIDNKPIEYTTITVKEDDKSLIAYNSIYGETAPIKPQEGKKYTIEDYDWREIIYRMALDFYQFNQLDDFLVKVAEANKSNGVSLYPSGTTGYEQYYIDMQGFWRQLYNPEPEPYYPEYTIVKSSEKFKSEIPLYNFERFKKIQGTDIDSHDRAELFALVDNEMVELLDAIKTNYNDSFYIGDTPLEVSKCWCVAAKDKTYKAIPFDKKEQVTKNELFYYTPADIENGIIVSAQYVLDWADLSKYKVYTWEEDNTYYRLKNIDETDTDVTPIVVLEDEELKQALYYNNEKYNKYLYVSDYDIEGNRIPDTIKQTSIKYYTKEYEYIVSNAEPEKLWWSKQIEEAPSQLNFWFDFLEAKGSELDQYSVQAIGDRTKVVNDDKVSSIYFREVPNLIFTTPEDYAKSNIKDLTGYTAVFVNNNLENLFSISAQGKSAKDKLDELLYNHTYCTESISITTIPIYHLQPNTRIFVRDEESKIDGEYIVSRLSIPLAYGGLMSITATKAPERLY